MSIKRYLSRKKSRRRGPASVRKKLRQAASRRKRRRASKYQSMVSALKRVGDQIRN